MANAHHSAAENVQLASERAPLATRSADLSLSVALFNSGWSAAISRPAKIQTSTTALGAATPGVVSLSISGLRPKVTSFRFPAVAAAPIRPAAAPAGSPGPAPTGAESAKSTAPIRLTRIKPPGDIIKLEDRMYYLLQPALETLVGGGAPLEMPFQPFPYQFEGVSFLYPRHAAVLADEMGLGKTMQAITALRLLIHSGEARSVLIVCPKPLVSNWRREIDRWAPELPVTTIEGDQARRRWQWGRTDAPIKLANYELLHRDRDAIVSIDQPFDLVVLDEAQRIKNASGTTSQVVRAIPRRRSWAMTGTPIENSHEDLVGIFEFLAPGYLNATMKPRRMGRLAADYVLRRTKDRVLTELPPKTIRDAEVELTAEQRGTYQLAEDEGVLRLTHLGESATIQHVFELVMRLKQICNFDPATGESSKFERLAADLEEVVDSGRKAIVFSQWVGTLTTLSSRLKRYGVLEYHGQIPQRRREDVLQRFKDDKKNSVLLLSYGSGGVGLNLQFAEYVFLFDRWWNPAVEDQAINRAHRIGAAGPVTVTRFLAVNTIEERIDEILRAKRELFDTVFSDAEPHRLGLTQQEIFGLFQLRGPNGPIEVAA